MQTPDSTTSTTPTTSGSGVRFPPIHKRPHSATSATSSSSSKSSNSSWNRGTFMTAVSFRSNSSKSSVPSARSTSSSTSRNSSRRNDDVLSVRSVRSVNSAGSTNTSVRSSSGSSVGSIKSSITYPESLRDVDMCELDTSNIEDQDEDDFINTTMSSDSISLVSLDEVYFDEENMTIDGTDDVVEFDSGRSSVELALDEFYEKQEKIRGELQTYLVEIKGKTDEDGEKLILFPEDHEETMANALSDKTADVHSILSAPSTVALQMIKATNMSFEKASEEIRPGDDLEEAIQKVRKLDFVLSAKMKTLDCMNDSIAEIVARDKRDREERERLRINMRRQAKEHLKRFEMESELGSEDNAEEIHSARSTNSQMSSSRGSERSFESKRSRSSSTSSRNPVMGIFGWYFNLSTEEEQRVDRILNDSTYKSEEGVNVPPGFGFIPSQDQLNRISAIDEALEKLKSQPEDPLPEFNIRTEPLEYSDNEEEEPNT